MFSKKYSFVWHWHIQSYISLYTIFISTLLGVKNGHATTDFSIHIFQVASCRNYKTIQSVGADRPAIVYNII
jgi:hypothetical protein